MKAIITCPICLEELGTIEKATITEEDISLYQQMVTCSFGHSTVQLVEE